jgi:mannose-6-phosphate isomerase-like protein (cupin superfamily)
MMMRAREAFALHTEAPETTDTAPPAAVVVRAEGDVTGEPLRRPISMLAFKVTGAQTGGRLLLVEHTHLCKGGPPLHVHHEQEEWFLVEEGRIVFQVGDQRLTRFAIERRPRRFAAGPARRAAHLLLRDGR